MSGIKYDGDKLPMHLIPTVATNELAKVFQMGAKKYGDRNWERGMNWSRLLGAAERHIQKIKMGEDIDPESGLLHSAHAMANMAMLTQYYSTYPEGDDRPHWYRESSKIGLDIDDVLADFVPYYIKWFGLAPGEPTSWNFDPHIRDRLAQVNENRDFWLGIPVKTPPQDIPFEPECYISSRGCPVEFTREWLQKHGYPSRPVYHVGHNQTKVQVAKESGITRFVDDRFENFCELNKAGICTFLFSAPHNECYNVGYRRINTLADVPVFGPIK